MISALAFSVLAWGSVALVALAFGYVLASLRGVAD